MALGTVIALDPPAVLPTRNEALDWSRIDAWTDRLLAGDLQPIALWFLRNGAAAPEAVWDPEPESLTAPPLRFLLDHWRMLAHDLAHDGSVPPARRIDALELKPALGYMMLLEPVDGGRDFRYRLYGSELARISGFDMTGQRLSTHPASFYAAEFGIASYRAVMRRRRPVYTVRHPVGARLARRWQSLALPFVDDAGCVTRILGVTVAVDRDGKMI